MDMQNVSSSLVALVCTAILVVGIAIGAFAAYPQLTLGSVETTHEYMATTTAATANNGVTITGDALVKRGPSTLGSVIITGANTGVLHIYNATTSNVLARTGNKATSTIHVASFPASAAAGTYTFDVALSDGILLELEAGNMPTTTVTYR